MGELVQLLEVLRQALDEAVKVVDERIERCEAAKKENYREYRSILRDMYRRLGELVNLMYIDRVLDPASSKALCALALGSMGATG